MDLDKGQLGSFPEMSLQDIVDALSAWGLPISKEQLSRPSTDTVTRIYSLCLERVTQVTDEALEEPLQDCTEGMEDLVRPTLFCMSLDASQSHSRN